MRENWDKDLPSEEMNAKIKRKCHVPFSRLDGGDSLDYCSVIYFIFLIGPGVGVVVGVDQEPGVGAGVGTAPPRLRTLGLNSAVVRALLHLFGSWGGRGGVLPSE